MWKIVTQLFIAGTIVSPLVTEVLRAVIHRRRERRDGLGGTQDIAMWGTLAGFACLLGAAISGLGWFFLG
jgi:hypothetical protein